MIPVVCILGVCLTLFAPNKDDRPELNTMLIPAELQKDAYSVIRESVTTYDITSPKVYSMHVQQTVTIFDNRTDDDVLIVSYDKYSKAKIMSASIYDRFGQLVRKIKKEDILDLSDFDDATLYSDNRHQVVQLVGGSLPYSLSYEYEIQFNGTRIYPPWNIQGFHTAVEKAEFHLLHPEELKIHVLDLNGVTAGQDAIEGKGMRHRIWNVKNAPAIPAELLAPPPDRILPVILLAPDKFEVDHYSGTMTDWNSFGKFIFDLNRGRELLTPQMAEQVRSLITSAESDAEKIRKLYDFIKNNMRYVSVQLGIGGWQAYDAQYVERNKYGDCKALSYFMKGLLAEAGIEAYPALVPLDKPSFFIDDFVTPGAFNHMMLYLPQQDIWLECTSSANPTGYIYDVSSDRDVLLITPDGGIKAHTPPDAIENSGTATYDTIFMDTDEWYMHGLRVYEYGDHDAYRYWQKNLPATEQEKRFREGFPLSIGNLEKLSYAVVPDTPVAKCAYHVNLALFGSVSGLRMFLPINALYRFETPCESRPRLLDIYREYPVNETNVMRIEIPDGYQVENVPAPKHVEDPRFGTFDLEVVQVEGAIEVKRILRIPRMQLEAAVYPDMCAFNKLIEAADKGTLVLKKSP